MSENDFCCVSFDSKGCSEQPIKPFQAWLTSCNGRIFEMAKNWNNDNQASGNPGMSLRNWCRRQNWIDISQVVCLAPQIFHMLSTLCYAKILDWEPTASNGYPCCTRRLSMGKKVGLVNSSQEYVFIKTEAPIKGKFSNAYLQKKGKRLGRTAS